MRRYHTDWHEKDWVWGLALVLAILASLAPVLFTHQIIRASDVLTQFFWSARQVQEQTPWEYLQAVQAAFHASWEPFSDGGRSLEGGWNAITLLVHRYLLQHYIPFPANIAWLAGAALAFAGLGTFWYCRCIGVGRAGAFLAGLIMALGTEHVSLINAGHIQKIEAIAWIPWVLAALELGLRERRPLRYGQVAFLLALQFFHMHWQISFYTCLTVGLYWVISQQFLWDERPPGKRLTFLMRDSAMVVVLLLLFFSLIAISFAPLLSWSKQSERGGGMAAEQGMSWSMPPEEILSYAVPGFFGLSRQEEGDQPIPGHSYYWGRMVMSQTNDYLGIFALMLAPVGFYRMRDRLGWLHAGLVLVTLLMALGGYTPVYRLMFDYLPGFSTFRVPKMVLCVTTFALAVLAGRGLDQFLHRESTVPSKGLLRWPVSLSLLLVLLWGVLMVQPTLITAGMGDLLTAGTRYQAGGEAMAVTRVSQMVRESGYAGVIAIMACLVLWMLRTRQSWQRPLLAVLFVMTLLDLARVNRIFLVVTTPPSADKEAAKTDVVRFLEGRIGHDRIQPVDEMESHYYSDYHLPTLASYVTVSERRYREFLDHFRLMSGMPDMMNVRFLVLSSQAYTREAARLASKYHPVFTATSGSVVLENRDTLPKAWTVADVQVVPGRDERLTRLMQSSFQPGRVALVEDAPPHDFVPGGTAETDGVELKLYQPNRITLVTQTSGSRLLVLGEKYYNWWYVSIDGKPTRMVPVNHILRGVYIPAGAHQVVWRFDPLPFKIGRYVTLGGAACFMLMWWYDWRRRRHG